MYSKWNVNNVTPACDYLRKCLYRVFISPNAHIISDICAWYFLSYTCQASIWSDDVIIVISWILLHVNGNKNCNVDYEMCVRECIYGMSDSRNMLIYHFHCDVPTQQSEHTGGVQFDHLTYLPLVLPSTFVNAERLW